MRKMMLLAVMMALAAMMLAAAPASAQEIEGENFGFFCDNDDDDGDGNEECEDIVVFFPFFNDFDEFCDNDDDEDFRCDDEDDFFGFGDFSGFGDVEQEAESGDVDQTFEVSGPGDNSNQTVGIQGVANTGNAQNAIGIAGDFDDGFFDDEDDCFSFDGTFICDGFDDGFFDDGFFGGTDFEFENVGATIELSPTQTIDSSQQVNQAAAASAFFK